MIPIGDILNNQNLQEIADEIPYMRSHALKYYLLNKKCEEKILLGSVNSNSREMPGMSNNETSRLATERTGTSVTLE